jgi:hypothetical protein
MFNPAVRMPLFLRISPLHILEISNDLISYRREGSVLGKSVETTVLECIEIRHSACTGKLSYPMRSYAPFAEER